MVAFARGGRQCRNDIAITKAERGKDGEKGSRVGEVRETRTRDVEETEKRR